MNIKAYHHGWSKLDSSQLPQKLYKYRSLYEDSFSKTLDVLINKRIYLPAPWQLNDPYEGTHKYHYEVTRNKVQEFSRTMGIYSMSLIATIPQLWVHYADNFRGICIEFNVSKTFCYAKPIIYSNDILNSNETSCMRQMGMTHMDLFSFLLRKSSGWAYEKEWRLLISNLNNHNDRYVYLENGDITSVILGANIDPLHEELIRMVLKEDITINIQKCKICEQSYDMIIE